MSAHDHGVLNVPLSKRGDIDAQIDRHKATKERDEAAVRKAVSKRIAEERVQAKRIVAAMTPERIAELAAKCNTTAAEVRRAMKSNAHWIPHVVIKTEGAK